MSDSSPSSSATVLGQFCVVSTPIGNLSDLSARARDTLGSADLVVAERRTRAQALLSALGVSCPILVWHDNDHVQLVDRVYERLSAGESVALTCDAGCPGIADPGGALVDGLWQRGITPSAIPGPSALTTVMMLSGWRARSWRFVGFLPRDNGERRSTLERMNDHNEAVVFFESPRRLAASIGLMLSLLDADREILIARELSKRFETLVRGTLEVVAQRNWSDVRGEITIALAPASRPKMKPSVAAPSVEALLIAFGRHAPLSTAVREVAVLTGLSRAEVYAMALELKSAGVFRSPS